MELYHDVVKVFTKLFKLQQADPPPILWEGVAAAMRFALLGLILLAVFLLVQTAICVSGRNMKSALFLALTAVVVGAIPLQILAVPIAATPAGTVMSITIQTPMTNEKGVLVYGNDVEIDTGAVAQLSGLLAQQTCRRTLTRTLPAPQEGSYHLVVALEGDQQYQILLTPEKGWRYFTQDTHFLCAMSNYNAFFTQIKSFLKEA